MGGASHWFRKLIEAKTIHVECGSLDLLSCSLELAMHKVVHDDLREHVEELRPGFYALLTDHRRGGALHS